MCDWPAREKTVPIILQPISANQSVLQSENSSHLIFLTRFRHDQILAIFIIGHIIDVMC